MELIFESSERNDRNNNARKKLEELNYNLITFEGYTVKSNKVSLLLDRAKLISKKPINLPVLFEKIKEELEDSFNVKETFANQLDIPWYFVVYREDETSVILDMLNNGKEVKRFNTFEDLGKWTTDYREYVMKSRYEEDGLPEIDVKMRASNIPWPGNMDKALCFNGEVVAIIEFQNTSRVSVKKHDNNQFFKPTYNAYGKITRKGDEFRWKALDILKQHAKLPLLVIVWSTQEDIVGLKLVDNIIYTADDKHNAGIVWNDNPVFTHISKLGENINALLNLE
ncbi:hypothetical protein ACRBU7_14410 [Priestia aryabhattai]|uniref:hypothetical protein n=1 Tax=Priestia aryabhattai TaxID=412384 RepID=UPI003D7F7542